MRRGHVRGVSRVVLLSVGLLFLSATCPAQQDPPTSDSERHSSPSEHTSPVKSPKIDKDTSVTGQEVAGDAKIISVAYRCAGKTSADTKPSTCTLTVSKSEFDALVHALDPKMSTSNRLSLASEYARLLIMAAEAEGRGISKSKDFQALAKFSTLQMLSTQLVRDINGDATLKASSTDADQYFAAHRNDYQEVTFDQIVVPVQNGSISHKTEPASERANKLRGRVLRGESFAELQAEVTGRPSQAAAAAGRVGPIRCLSLQESLRKVCSLKPEEISEVISDGGSLVIAKVVSRRALPIEEVREEIRATVERQRLQSELDRVRNPVSMQLDERYFGELPDQDVAHKHGMQFPSATVTGPSKSSDPSVAPHKH
jgi:hypothetical protein